MGKPKKIRKKNSILFTTKHHSFNGIMGTVLLVLCLMIMITSILFSFHNRGEVSVSFGYYGFLTAILNVIGLIAGISGTRERDAFIYAPIVSVVGNSLMLVFWVFLMFVSRS